MVAQVAVNTGCLVVTMRVGIQKQPLSSTYTIPDFLQPVLLSVGSTTFTDLRCTGCFQLRCD